MQSSGLIHWKVILSLSFIVFLAVSLIPGNVAGSSNFARVGAITLNPGESASNAAVIDPVNGFAYFGTFGSLGTIVKIRLSDFTRVGALTLNVGEDDVSTGVIDAGRGFAYFGAGAFPGSVVKVKLSDFTRVGALVLPFHDYIATAAIDTQNGFGYFGTTSGHIVKVRLSDLSIVGDMQIPIPNGYYGIYAYGSVIDAGTGYAYFAPDIRPGSVFKISLSNFAIVRTLTLKVAGEDSFASAVIDPTRGFAYFGTDTVPGRVVKINLSDFSRVGSIVRWTYEQDCDTALIDPDSGYAYFGALVANQGSRVLKVNLADFSFVDELTLGESPLISAVLDPINGFAYFAVSCECSPTPAPGEIVKILVGARQVTSTTRTASGSTSQQKSNSGSNTIAQPSYTKIDDNHPRSFQTGSSLSVIIGIVLGLVVSTPVVLFRLRKRR